MHCMRKLQYFIRPLFIPGDNILQSIKLYEYIESCKYNGFIVLEKRLFYALFKTIIPQLVLN